MDVDQTNLLKAMKCHETRHVNPPMHNENVKVSKKATPVGGGRNHRKPCKDRVKAAEEKKQRAEFNRCAKKTMRSFGVSFLCATFINIINQKLLNGDYKTKGEYEDAVHKIEDFCKVKLLDRMPRFGEVEFTESAD